MGSGVKRDDLYYQLTDFLSGDESLDKLIDGIDMDSIRKTLSKISGDETVSQKTRTQLLAESWRINYRIKPPTIEEFLTPDWIGDMANSLFPHARRILTEFWQPDSPYRHLILASAVGLGKAQPYSSKVAVDSEDVIEIELEDGEKISINPSWKVVIEDREGAKVIPASQLSEEVDFPIPIFYMTGNIYVLENLPEFKEAFSIGTYDELINFFKKFDKKYFKSRNVFTQIHHILPLNEGGTDNGDNLICLPLFFHEKAHYLRAKEHEAHGRLREALNNYKSALWANSNKNVLKVISKEFYQLDFMQESFSNRNRLESLMVYIKKEGEKSKKVFDYELESYLQSGWRIGRAFKDATGKKWVEKEGKKLLVNEEEVDFYLSEGYLLGMGEQHRQKMRESYTPHTSTLNTKWMNKEGIRKCVPLSEVDNYLREGWSIGSASSTCKGKTWKWKKKCHWFTNGIEDTLAEECPIGYWRGRTFGTSKKNK